MAGLKTEKNSNNSSFVVGHQDQMRVLSQNLYQRSSASLLLSGLSGIGKRKAAMQIAQTQLCHSPVENLYCGVCPSCQQVRLGHSVSLHFLEPEDELIRVDDVQKLLSIIHLRSLTMKRFVVIDAVEKMNLQAANTILKTLEEPPEGLYFFLITSQISRVLKTIRSRSQVILFHPLQGEELQTIFPDAPPELIQQARGQASKAADLIDDSYRSRLEQCQHYLDDFFKEDFVLLDNGWREFMKNKDHFLFMIGAWEEILLRRWKAAVESNLEASIYGRILSGLSRIRRQMRFRPDDILQIESLWAQLKNP